MPKRAKKGFSLLEMLIVIAIIAVLISIVVPIASTETTKAAAAANAANLRTVMAQVSNKRVSNEDGFMDGYQASVKNAGQIITDALSPVLEWFGWTGFSEWASEKLYQCSADSDGNLSWINGKTLLTGVPAAKRMKVKDKNGNELIVDEGSPMFVYISDYSVAATYYTVSGQEFSVTDFADVAEDGVYDGDLSVNTGSGNVIEQYTDIAACIAAGKHNPVGANNCYCVYCHQQDHTSEHICTREGCTYHYQPDSNGDGKCDLCHTVEELCANGIHLDDVISDCYCSKCSTEVHTFVSTQEKCLKGCGTTNPDYVDPNVCQCCKDGTYVKSGLTSWSKCKNCPHYKNSHS